ncbi:IS4 family transposase [Lactobacillus delbrueckii subsp. bulgaricus]
MDPPLSQSLHHSCPQRTIRMSSGRPRRSTSAQSRPRGGLWPNQRGVVIQLLDQALKAGLTAKYVMFDTWFSNPHQIVQISQRGLNVIAMVKKSSKITYEFEEKRINVKQIFNACKKRRGRSRYLLSVPVKVGGPAKDGAQIDARIVCVRNRSNRKDWIALICTDMTIDENEIIRIYGKRWDIEVFFKTCKNFLKLGTEYHGLSYDALTAHTAFVFLRYMFMSVEKRDDEDDRTIGELFSTLSQVLSTILGNFILK